jgi:hypothetical protein
MLQLSKRERLLLTILIAVVAVIAVYFLILSPLISWRTSINSKSENNISKVEKLKKIYEEYQEIKQKRIQYESQINSGQGITTLIEETAKNLNIINNKSFVRVIPGNVKSNYKKVSADVKFVGIEIGAMLKFIYSMEHSSSLVKVSYVRVSEALKGKDIYDVEMKFDSVISQ